MAYEATLKNTLENYSPYFLLLNASKSPVKCRLILKSSSGRVSNCCCSKWHSWTETRRTVCAALRSNGARTQRRRTERTEAEASWIHTRSACRSLPDKLWKSKPLASWEYAARALGAVDISRLDGKHVTAAGDHGTEQVRLADPREQSAPRQQEGTCRSRCCAVG